MHNITYKKCARRVTLRITRDGTLQLAVPIGFPSVEIERFIQKSEAWIEKRRKELAGRKFFSDGTGTKRHYEKHKGAAKDYIEKLVAITNSSFGFRFNKITVKNQSSRWGSCSRKGILNFNYRLLFLPRELAEYVVVHELCHVKHFDHSKKFWQEVQNVLPNYKELKGELRKYSLELAA